MSHLLEGPPVLVAGLGWNPSRLTSFSRRAAARSQGDALRKGVARRPLSEERPSAFRPPLLLPPLPTRGSLCPKLDATGHRAPVAERTELVLQGAEAGRGGSGSVPLRASSCRSPVPDCPLGPIHHATAAPLQARPAEGQGPAPAGRREPLAAIFNLIKAVSTIDFGSFNY